MRVHPCRQTLFFIAFQGMCREREYGKPYSMDALKAANLLCCGDPIHFGHLDVHQNRSTCHFNCSNAFNASRPFGAIVTR